MSATAPVACSVGSASRSPSQLPLFDLHRADNAWQQFLEWKQLPGAGHVLRDLYALAAPYAARHRRTHITVSIKLLFELERDRIKRVRARAQAAGIRLPAWKGYTLNNTLTAPIARHIVERRPDWAGMFEHRESPGKRRKKWALIVN